MSESDRIQTEVDRMVDWYKANRQPQMEPKEIQVKAAARHLLKFATPIIPGELYRYRGYLLRRLEDAVN